MEYLNWSHRNMYDRNYNNAVVPNEFRRYHPNHHDNYPQQQYQPEFARDQRTEPYMNEGLFRIKNEVGFKAAIACAVVDVILSVSFLMVILALTRVFLAPPPPKLLILPLPPPKSTFTNSTHNETVSVPTNNTRLPLEKRFYCKKIVKQALMADFLAQLVYTGGGVCVVFGAVTRRASLCSMHFPSTLIAIIIGIGIRIIEVIYCKWFLMRWLWFIIQFVWFTFGDGVAKSIIVYLEDRGHNIGRMTHSQNPIITNT
ncbi:hypothetical protein Ocin01_14072 [Orchesella cincta]|uniref:Uncharacterized protein n=1 Tax=Orchesella cincta TaxID=48709 RepID=A0A1D2MI21_ORCCI|nr:hypothetical protein Ocin01_14072 [Orchesella cincta]